MRYLYACALLLCCCSFATVAAVTTGAQLNNNAAKPQLTAEQDSYQAVRHTLQLYLNGTSYNQQQQIKQAFHPQAELFLAKEGQPIWQVPVDEYLSWFKPTKAGQFNGRIGEILSIEIEGDLASAKAEILQPESGKRFIDMFLLKRIEGQWQIISKAAVGQSSLQHGQRVLFILSDAHFHGKSDLPAGASFSEIVKAYSTFKAAGFTVDFMTPSGGAVPLAYIDTSDPLHKEYLYNHDFMQALKHSKTAAELKAADYQAVHYVGGSNAVYGVADDPAIAQLVMDIYQQHQGIISAVCHGTAGLLQLKTTDGRFLVTGKKLTGYPEDFEQQDAAYFKHFPLLIKKTILERGGQFAVGPRNQAFVQVDGRLVTGQNHLSSVGVARAVITLIQQKNPAQTATAAARQ
ncbi:nuclear transport factor 2 family protein [Rheinheimera sp.]|uniref:nuclear transport factor 2 family protein n=1 Tax=Rheinheimera sp. TaxID=1869214 RepID=UPI0027B88489|nr:nuclear transport factor 2 family protein [Rheinheimera sp.]